MNWSKFNLVQALGAIIAIVFYLVGPVVGISLFPMGLRGTTAMRIDFVFVIPVILLGITILISVLPIGRLSSIAGIVTAITILIIGLCGGDVLVGKIKAMGLVVANAQFPELSGLFSNNLNILDYAGVFLSIGWGALVALCVLFVCSVVGIFVMSIGGNGNTSNPSFSGRSSSSRPSAPMTKTSTSPHSRGNGAGNLYRR